MSAAPDRPCLVMLPGTLCDERLFARQARALEPATRVWRTDYPGLPGASSCGALLARMNNGRWIL